MQPNEVDGESTVPRGMAGADHEPEPEDELVPQEVLAFRRAVVDDVARRLAGEPVEVRLARLERAAESRSRHAEDIDKIVRKQARYAYQVVASWFTIIFDPALPELAGRMPTYDEVDSLARDTVARTVVRFREELARIRPWLKEESPDFKRLFLLECLLHLPDAYQRWLRKTEQLSWDDVEQIGADSSVADPSELLRRLDDRVRNHQEWVIERLRSGGFPGTGRGESWFSDVALAEIVDATVETLDAAVREWAPDVGRRS